MDSSISDLITSRLTNDVNSDGMAHHELSIVSSLFAKVYVWICMDERVVVSWEIKFKFKQRLFRACLYIIRYDV